MLRCAVLFCVVSGVICCTVPCYTALLCCAMLPYAVFSYVLPCSTVLCHDLLCSTMLCSALPCSALPCSAPVCSSFHRSTTACPDAALQQSHAGHTQAVVHAPPLPIPWGTHHSKFFLFLTPSTCRVVIHTANLISCDCNSKNQAVWVQDFPIRSTCTRAAACTSPTRTAPVFEASRSSVPTVPNFGQDFIEYL